MQKSAAIRRAIDIVQVPTRVRAVRTEPLPEGIDQLLSVAVGEPEAVQAAAAFFKRPPTFLRNAASFYIEQILLAPEADSYRILGGAPSDTPSELRRHMALMVRWLHPDVAEARDRSIFAARVTTAWENLKTADRRLAYDTRRGAQVAPAAGRARKRRRHARPSATQARPSSALVASQAWRRLVEWALFRRPKQH